MQTFGPLAPQSSGVANRSAVPAARATRPRPKNSADAHDAYDDGGDEDDDDCKTSIENE